VAVALAALALALPAALFVLWPLARRRPAAEAPAAEDARIALEGEKAMTFRALRELDGERQAGLLAEADYAGLRVRYEAQASAILRRLDALGPAPRPPVPAAPPPGALTPWTRQPAVLTLGAFALLGFGVTLGALATRYTAPAPPEPMAAPAPATAPGSARPLPPAMLEGMLRAARASFEAGRYEEAAAAYQAVLKRQPENVDALTHFGALLAMAGHVEAGLGHLERALALRGDDPEALWYKAGVLYRLRHDYPGAIAAWERFTAVAPDDVARDQARTLIHEARARLAGSPTKAEPAATTPPTAAPGATR